MLQQAVLIVVRPLVVLSSFLVDAADELRRTAAYCWRSAVTVQAWGLMELQKGNPFAAVKLLDRSAQYDPKCKPVQRWKLYQDARKTVSNRRGGEAADRSP